MANTRIKVRREDLIARLEASLETEVAAHVKRQEKYAVDSAKAGDRVIAAIQKTLGLPVKSLMEKLSTGYRGEVSLNLGKIPLGSKPQLQTHKLEQMIRVLKSSCDDTILVAVGDDYSRYL